MAQVNLSGNLTHKVSSYAIADFVILKAFNATIHHPKPPDIIEIMWQPPIFEWVKCNSNGVVVGLNGLAACWGIFRNMNVDHLGSFDVNIDNGNALKAELTGAMFAVEIVYQNNFGKLWLDIDSKLVVAAFNSVVNFDYISKVIIFIFYSILI